MIWVIAHRGASAEERENTLPAFERAIELGADFVELDVQVASDGTLVVFHDLDLARLTPLRGPVRRRTAAELREHGIPTLEEVVELTRGRIGVMAELKGVYRDRRHDLGRRGRSRSSPRTTSCCRTRAGRCSRRDAGDPASVSCSTSATASRSARLPATRGPSASTTGASRSEGSSAPGASGCGRRSTRSTTPSGCGRLPHSASTGSSRIVRVEHGRRCRPR